MITNKAAPRGVPLGPVLQRYFCSHLLSQRNVSPRTVSAYRDAFRLLLPFLHRQYGIAPESLCVDDLSVPNVLAFLADLETSRGNCIRSRNARLAAIRAFMRYAARDEPRLLAAAQRVLAIPVKRFDRPTIGHLTREQIQAILDAPDTTVLVGQRDQLLLLLLYNTGARVSEVAALKVQDVCLTSQAFVRICGKGRKQRTVPLWRHTMFARTADNLAYQPHRKIVAAGYTDATNGDVALGRYNVPSGLEERYFAQSDASYNVTSISNANGQVAERCTYQPFGSFVALGGSWEGLQGGVTQVGWRNFDQGGRYDATMGQNRPLGN